MTQVYLPFPTSLNSQEALLVQAVLKDCIPCRVMCMAPRAVPRHSWYTHVHEMGMNIYVTITARTQQNGSSHMDSFKALVEDSVRLLMKGVLLPFGHYPVADTSYGVQTSSSLAAPPTAGGNLGGASMENSTMALLDQGVALTDFEYMYSGPI